MGVIAMNRTALIAVAVVLSLISCATPEPPDTAGAEDRRSEPAPQPPDPGLVAKAIQQAEAAIEVAENAQWYLAQSRGARRSMVYRSAGVPSGAGRRQGSTRLISQGHGECV